MKKATAEQADCQETAEQENSVDAFPTRDACPSEYGKAGGGGDLFPLRKDG
jgi:hypothetical protein